MLERARAGKNFGVVLIPEGLVGYIAEVRPTPTPKPNPNPSSSPTPSSATSLRRARCYALTAPLLPIYYPLLPPYCTFTAPYNASLPPCYAKPYP